jgi:PEP-CTERM/exosortase A-associated glycosyltransferase
VPSRLSSWLGKGRPIDRAGEAVALSEAGQRAYAAGDYGLARRLFIGAAELQPDPAPEWLWLARTERQRGDAIEAEASAMRALLHRPDWPAAYRELVEIAAVSGDRARVITVLQRFQDVAPTDAFELTWMLGRLTELGAEREARDLAESMRARRVGEHVAIAWLAGAAARSGGEAEGERYLRETLAGLPAAAATRAETQYALSRGDLDRATRVFLAGDTSRFGYRDVRALTASCFEHGRLIDAERIAAAAAATRPGDERFARIERSVRGQNRVLRGEWAAPGISRRSPGAVPGRVLHVVARSLPYRQTGYTLRTQAIARAQLEIGLDPHVVTRIGYPWREGTPGLIDEEVEGVPYHRLPIPADPPVGEDGWLTAHAEGLAELVARERPMLLHAASDFANGLVANHVARSLGLPSIYEARGFWEESWLARASTEAAGSERYRCARERETEAMLGATHVVTLSEGMAREIEQRGVPRERISVVPNGVDVERFRPVERDDALAQSLGLTSGDVVMGYISRLSRYEGVRHLVEAIAELAGQGEPVRGLIVGDGDELPALRRQASELGVGDRIVFTGRVPHAEVLRYHGLIDIFVVPRTADRVSQLVTPLKPLEAMACATALIVSGVDALREMVAEGETGLTFVPEDAADLARVAAPLIHDRDRRRELGERARAWVAEHRTWRAHAERYRVMYERLATSH